MCKKIKINRIASPFNYTGVYITKGLELHYICAATDLYSDVTSRRLINDYYNALRKGRRVPTLYYTCTLFPRAKRKISQGRGDSFTLKILYVSAYCLPTNLENSTEMLEMEEFVYSSPRVVDSLEEYRRFSRRSLSSSTATFVLIKR